ncbi:MAG: signal peptide peptidase SppA, partial [bacterium]|nr:signal peptide peptidase SppA [bacterium]
ILFALVGLTRTCSSPVGPFSKAVGVLEVNGTLWVSDDLVKQIESFRKNQNIRSVVVRINSPGGTVGASQEIYSALQNLSQKKPVVASMGTIAASGGLYVAMGAQKVFADPGTLTGSIGVKMQHIDIGSLLKFLKIEMETIKSGRFKDMASFTKPLGPEEAALLESLMQEIHGQFKEAVSKSRNIPMETLDTFADGRIFTGAKAKELNLVDALGDFLDAVKMAAQMGGIKGEPELVYGEKEMAWWVKSLFGEAKAAVSGPLAFYLYP